MVGFTDHGALFGLLLERGVSAGLDTSVPTLIRVGTMCSGTDAPLHALNALNQAAENTSGRRVVEVDYLFGVEIVPFKQAFILNNSAPGVLFQRVEDFFVAEGDVEGSPKLA